MEKAASEYKECADRGHPELGLYRVMREWFKILKSASKEETFKLIAKLVGEDVSTRHTIEECPSLAQVFELILKKTNNPDVPDEARYWVCPEKDMTAGTYVQIFEGEASLVTDPPETLEDVRLRLEDLADGDIKPGHLQTIFAEIGETIAFTTLPSKTIGNTETCDHPNVQIKLVLGGNACASIPTVGQKIHALIKTKRRRREGDNSAKNMTLLFFAELEPHHEANEVIVNKDREREYVYTIARVHDK